MADIGNAYLNAPCHEKVHVTVGPELFGKQHEGKTAIIARALYGLKSAGASWRRHLSETIIGQLNYSPSLADPDVYFKPKTSVKGEKYYAYLIVYVDDILSIDINPKVAIDLLSQNYRIKDGSVQSPNMYLGTNIRKWKIQTEDGTDIQTYAMGSSSYVKDPC